MGSRRRGTGSRRLAFRNTRFTSTPVLQPVPAATAGILETLGTPATSRKIGANRRSRRPVLLIAIIVLPHHHSGHHDFRDPASRVFSNSPDLPLDCSPWGLEFFVNYWYSSPLSSGGAWVFRDWNAPCRAVFMRYVKCGIRRPDKKSAIDADRTLHHCSRGRCPWSRRSIGAALLKLLYGYHKKSKKVTPGRATARCRNPRFFPTWCCRWCRSGGIGARCHVARADSRGESTTRLSAHQSENDDMVVLADPHVIAMYPDLQDRPSG